MRIGLLVNPIAGMGGSVGLAGTDGAVRLAQARELGAQPKAGQRCIDFLSHLAPVLNASDAQLLTLPGAAGADCCAAAGVACHVVQQQEQDTENGSRAGTATLVAGGVDLIVFVGGDGTARDVMANLPAHMCALGVPAGVKMHSGVFAVTPRAAAKVVETLLSGGLVALHRQEVRDFQPGQDGQDQLQVVTIGDMLVPDQGGYMQHTKVGGVESEPLVAEEIAAYVCELLAGHTLIIGPGSTCLAIKQQLGVEGTLRGFDIVAADNVQLNATEPQLLTVLQQDESTRVVLSFTRQQGFLLGRGNQQLSARCLGVAHWPDQFTVVGSRTKLNTLQGRPLLVDTSEPQLDHLLSGVVPIVAGYEDELLYRVASDYANGS